MRKIIVLDDDPTGVQTVHDVFSIQTGQKRVFVKALMTLESCSIY